MKMNKSLKKYGFILSILIIISLFVTILNFIPTVCAENDVQIVADTNSISTNSENFDDLSKQFTNQELDFDNIDMSHMEKIIPIQILKKTGVYGYIGKEYGYLVDVTKAFGLYLTNAMIIDVEYILNKSTNTIEYSLTPKCSMTINYYTEDSTSISAVEEKDGSDLYMGNIFLFSEFNTVHEMNRKDLQYDIYHDNSIYVDMMWANFNSLVVRDEYAELKALASVGADLLLAPFEDAIDTICGFPVSSLLDFIVKSTSTTFECLSDVKYNALSYQNQVANGKLQTNAALAIDSNLFLGDCKQNGQVKFFIKYDNKMHCDEDFQIGMKLGFDIFRRSNSHFTKVNTSLDNDKILQYDNYNVYNNYQENNRFSLKCNATEKVNDKIVEKRYINKFLFENEEIDLFFIAPNNREYDFSTTQGTILDVSSINATKGSKYNLKYYLRNTNYGQIDINAKSELQFGQNDIFEGMYYLRLQQQLTDAYIYETNSALSNNLYITDEFGNIVNSVNGTEITSILQSNKHYKLYIFSEGEQNINITEQVSNSINDNIKLNKNEKYYFSYVSPLQNYWYFEGNYFDFAVYNEYGEIVLDDRLLLRNRKYYFEIVGNDAGQVNYKLSYQYVNEVLDVSRPLVEELNEIIRFVPTESLVYTFVSGNNKFDLYTKDGILDQNVNEYYLERGKEYFFVNVYNASYFKITYKILNLLANENVKLEANVIYKIVLQEFGFYDTINNKTIKIYDNNASTVEYKNGYRLYDNEFYMVANAQTDIMLSKKIIPVIVVLDDGYSDVTKNTIVNYGNYFDLEVPVRKGYHFNGWLLNGELITNDQGQGAIWENINNTTLQASWSVKNLYVQLNNNNDVLWVTEDGLKTSSTPLLTMETLNKVVDNLLALVYTDQLAQEGYWKEIKLVKESEDLESYMLQFEVVWTKEQYRVNFICKDGTVNTYNVTYGEPFDIKNIIIYQNNLKNDYDINWVYNNKTYYFTDSTMDALIDYTPNNENKFIVDVNYEERRVGKPAQVKLNITMEGKLQPVKIINDFYVGEERALSEFIDYYNHYEFVNCSGTNVTITSNSNLTNPLVLINHASGAEINVSLRGKNYNISIKGLNDTCELYGDYKKGEIKEFVATYNTANPVIGLPSIMQIRKNHDGWEVLGKKYSVNDIVTIPAQHWGDITIEPLFVDKIIRVYNNDCIIETTDVPNYYDYIIYDLTSASNNVRIIIDKGIEHVRLLNDGSLINHFFFGAYLNNITVDMVQCDLKGRDYVEKEQILDRITNGYVAYFDGHNSQINLYGDNKLTQGTIDDGALALLTGALTTKDMTVMAQTSDAKLTLIGTSASKTFSYFDGIVNGNSAGHGWLGPILNQYNHLIINIYANVYTYGGNGKDGEDNKSIPAKADKGNIGTEGYSGGEGGVAGAGMFACCIVNVGSGYTLHGEPGKPGAGARGGTGGEGADAVWFGPSAKIGGKGGRGGDGGMFAYGIIYDEIRGQGKVENHSGYVASGGAGGNGGLGGFHLTNKRANSGSPGEKGNSSAPVASMYMSRSNLALNPYQYFKEKILTIAADCTKFSFGNFMNYD